MQGGVELRGVAGEAVEVGEGDGALALGALDFDGGAEGGHGDVHVGGVGGDAGFAAGRALVGLAEDGVDAVDSP